MPLRAEADAPVKLTEANGVTSERLGVTVAALPGGQDDDGTTGLAITGLDQGGAGAIAGLRLGDVIVEVSGTPVGDARELETALEQIGTDNALLRIARDGQPFFIGVKLQA